MKTDIARSQTRTPAPRLSRRGGVSSSHDLILDSVLRAFEDPRGSAGDDSLLIDDPLLDESLEIPQPAKTFAAFPLSPRAKNHPTARTFTYNLDESSPEHKRRKRMASKYFADTKENQVLIESSSPRKPNLSSNEPYSRTNPFTTSTTDGEKRRALPAPTPAVTIDLTESPNERPNQRNVVAAVIMRQKSMASSLGLSDQNGRPVKGLAHGAKVKRRP